jgi:hypothetical protein
MLISKLLLLPVAVASSVTVYMHSVPQSTVVLSPIPLAHIEFDIDQSTGTATTFTPPHGSFSPDHFLRIGLEDAKSKSWRGVVTSAASFREEYKKKFTIHVDEKGEPYHIGFNAYVKGQGDEVEVEVEVVKRGAGPKPALNRPIVLNPDGKLDTKEPEKTFLQKSVYYIQAIDHSILISTGTGGLSLSSSLCSLLLAEVKSDKSGHVLCEPPIGQAAT